MFKPRFCFKTYYFDLLLKRFTSPFIYKSKDRFALNNTERGTFPFSH